MLYPEDIYVLNTYLTIAERWEYRAKLIRETVERAFELRTMKGIDDMPAFAFNSQGIDAQYSGGGGGLPVGKHPVTITASQLKPTADNTGGYIEFTLTAFDGPSKGTNQLDRLNMHNKNPQAVEIANKQLAAYCAVTNTPAFNATEELHNKPFVVEIGLQKAPNPNGYTEVIGLFDMAGNKPGEAGAGPQQSQQPNNGFGQQQGGGQGGFGAAGTGTIPNNQNGGGAWGNGAGAGGGQGGQPDPNANGGGQGGAWGNGAGAGGAQQQQGGGAAAGGGAWAQGAGAGAGGATGGQPGWGQR